MTTKLKDSEGNELVEMNFIIGRVASFKVKMAQYHIEIPLIPQTMFKEVYPKRETRDHVAECIATTLSKLLAELAQNNDPVFKKLVSDYSIMLTILLDNFGVLAAEETQCQN